MSQAGLVPGAGNEQCVKLRAAGPPGICKLGFATITLEIGLGTFAFIWAGRGFRLTHATNERTIVLTATMGRLLRGVDRGRTGQCFASLITVNIPKLMPVAGDRYVAFAILPLARPRRGIRGWYSS